MSRLSDDTRNRLLRETAAASRRNRPRWMTTLGLLAVLVALLYAWLGWSARAEANADLRTAQLADHRLGDVLDQIKSFQRSPEEGEQVWFEPMTGWQSMVEEAADRVGLERPAPPTFDRPDKVSDRLSRNIFRYSNVQAPSAATLLAWLVEVERSVEGMRVHSLDLNAVGKTGWRMTVTFSRLEKTS